MTTYQAFFELFSKAERIEFDTSWHNGTGYLDGAAKVKVGAVRSFIDDKKRRGIMIPCSKGSVVIFERYSGGQDEVLVSNAPRRLFVSALTEGDMALAVQLAETMSYTAEVVRTCSANFYDPTAREEELKQDLEMLGFNHPAA